MSRTVLLTTTATKYSILQLPLLLLLVLLLLLQYCYCCYSSILLLSLRILRFSCIMLLLLLLLRLILGLVLMSRATHCTLGVVRRSCSPSSPPAECRTQTIKPLLSISIIVSDISPWALADKRQQQQHHMTKVQQEKRSFATLIPSLLCRVAVLLLLL